MLASDLEILLVSRLVRERGSTAQFWRRAVGRVIVHDRMTHAHCNWEIRPTGNDAQCLAIEALLDEIRVRHPIVDEG